MIHRSAPTPGARTTSDSGVYAGPAEVGRTVGGEEAGQHGEPAEQVEPVAHAR